MTLTLSMTLDRVILHAVVHRSSTSTHMPNFIEIEETFCGRTDEHLRPALLGPVHTSNNVEATFDFVERIVQLVAFDNVASTLLIVWTGI